jgi:hypothetical protein
MPQEVLMSESKVLAFGENQPSMTIADGLAFIDRTRRQLERFDTAIPHADGTTIAPQDRDAIRAKCDKVEAEIQDLLGIR